MPSTVQRNEGGFSLERRCTNMFELESILAFVKELPGILDIIVRYGIELAELALRMINAM